MRGAAPAGGQDSYAGDVALTLGGSRIEAKGKVTNTLDIDARFEPLQLNDLLPEGAGTVRGTVKLTGARTSPNIDADLTGSGVSYAGYSAQGFSVQGRLPWRGGSGALAIRANGVEVGTAIETLTLDARGAVENLQLQGEARSEIGALALSGNASKRGNTWQGALASLQLAPVKGAQWQLRQPAQFRWDGRSGALSNACLASSGGGSLCANADWPRRGLDVRGEALPLTLLLPYLPERSDRRPWILRGDVNLDAQLRPAGNAWRGTAHLTSASGAYASQPVAMRASTRPSSFSVVCSSAVRRCGSKVARRSRPA
jgi:translocation and assembly module TamB